MDGNPKQVQNRHLLRMRRPDCAVATVLRNTPSLALTHAERTGAHASRIAAGRGPLVYTQAGSAQNTVHSISIADGPPEYISTGLLGPLRTMVRTERVGATTARGQAWVRKKYSNQGKARKGKAKQGARTAQGGTRAKRPLGRVRSHPSNKGRSRAETTPMAGATST